MTKAALAGRLRILRTGGLYAAVLQDSLFQLFLALNAMAGPGYGLQALGIDLGAAGYALTEAALTDTLQRAIHHLQQLAIVVALMEEEFLVIGVGSPIGDVLCGFHVGVAAILGRPRHGVPQFPLALL